MQKNDYAIGGEQSGHIIIKKYATTGDGILTALMLVEEMCDFKSPISKLCDGLLVYPQYTKNVRVSKKALAIADPKVESDLKEVEELIGDEGRVLLRESGTEPVIRIMVECKSRARCEEYADIIAVAIEEGGHTVG
jgi:phosphoglucosamine mutase